MSSNALAVLDREEQQDQLFAMSLRESFERVCLASKALRKASMMIAWEAAFIVRHEGWTTLGYRDEDDMREAAGVARSQWYKLVRIASSYSHLSRDQFLSMTIENAYRLTQAPRVLQFDSRLIEQAGTLNSTEFDRSVVRIQAEAENKPVKDTTITWQMKLRTGQARAIKRGLKQFCVQHHITDEAYGLELLVAESCDRITMVGFITECIPRLTGQILEIGDVETLRSVMAQHIRELGELLKFCIHEEDEDGA
jgi:hypothetical protein